MEEFFSVSISKLYKIFKVSQRGITKLQCINVVDDCSKWKLEWKVVCACITVLVQVIAAMSDSVSVV